MNIQSDALIRFLLPCSKKPMGNDEKDFKLHLKII